MSLVQGYDIFKKSTTYHRLLRASTTSILDGKSNVSSDKFHSHLPVYSKILVLPVTAQMKWHNTLEIIYAVKTN